MTVYSDLTGLGMAPALANRVGDQVATVAGVGTTQAGAAQIGTSVTIATTGVGEVAFVLPVLPVLLKPYYVFNTSATSGTVFPPGSTTLNGGSSAVSVAQNKGTIFMCVSGPGTGSDVWVALAGA